MLKPTPSSPSRLVLEAAFVARFTSISASLLIYYVSWFVCGISCFGALMSLAISRPALCGCSCLSLYRSLFHFLFLLRGSTCTHQLFGTRFFALDLLETGFEGDRGV